jgi:hypothetical protein
MSFPLFFANGGIKTNEVYATMCVYPIKPKRDPGYKRFPVARFFREGRRAVTVISGTFWPRCVS